MRAFVRTSLCTFLALALAGCGGDAPAPAEAPGAATPAPVAPAAAALDANALRERASASLAANRLYAPAGDNAVEDYLALRERQPGDAAVETALVDLAPYVIIGAEQATAARDFAEAERLIALLVRMDETAPAGPRLREALADERLTAEAEAEAEAQALAEREAAEASEAERAAEATRTAAASVAAPSAPSTPVPAPPAAATQPPAPRPVAAAPAPAPRSAPAPTPAAEARTAAPMPSARQLVSRVPARFPESALRRRLEGEVEVALTIRRDGTVASVDVVRADPPGVFDREAVLAVRRWRYVPAEAESQARVVLQFRRPS